MNRLSSWPVWYQEKAKASPIQFRSTDPSSDTVPRLSFIYSKQLTRTNCRSHRILPSNPLLLKYFNSSFFLQKRMNEIALNFNWKFHSSEWSDLNSVFPQTGMFCSTIQHWKMLIPADWFRTGGEKNCIANGPPGRNGPPAFQWKRFKFGKNYKIEKRNNDVDRFLYCNIFIYFQIKTSFIEKEFVPESKCCTLRKVHFHLLHLSA